MNSDRDLQSPRRILHALAVSMPHQNGYTVRSRYIVETQRLTSWAQPTVVTSPFYPGNSAAIDEALIAGIKHHRVPHPSDVPLTKALSPGDLACRLLFRLRKSTPAVAVHQRLLRLRDDPAKTTVRVSAWPKVLISLLRRLLTLAPIRVLVDRCSFWLEIIEEGFLLRRFARGIERVAQETGAEIIHAHSPYRTALPAIRAARTLGLPVVYEVRGMWEESAVASTRFRSGGHRYRHWRDRETEAMGRVDAVITICDTLRREVVSRGVAPDRIFVIPNAVDPERFRPLTDAEVAAAPSETAAVLDRLSRRLKGTVLGYVGSVRRMEGVDELVRGAAEGLRAGRDLSVLVVGDGPELQELANLATRLGIADRVLLPGRVPHDQVAYYYRLIDIFVVSRPDYPVTRTVTPLKPLEAMAMGKALIVSDLPALHEVVEDGQTGLFYRVGDATDLARQAGRLIDAPRLLEEMGRSARRWVTEQRTWHRVLGALTSVYAAAGGWSGLPLKNPGAR